MTEFPKDIWQKIIEFIAKPKDFLTIALICKCSSRACQDFNVRDRKALEFSSQEIRFYNGVVFKKYRFLAYHKSQLLHGLYKTFIWKDGVRTTMITRFHLGNKLIC